RTVLRHGQSRWPAINCAAGRDKNNFPDFPGYALLKKKYTPDNIRLYIKCRIVIRCFRKRGAYEMKDDFNVLQCLGQQAPIAEITITVINARERLAVMLLIFV